MNGFIPRTLLGLALCLTGLTGCACYRDIVDPCWPQRYDAMAASSVNEVNNAQAYNGHVLDQTVWNFDFEHDPRTGAPTAILSPGGMERLKYISRRRPVADCRIYLATAQDLPALNVSPPDKVLIERNDLNSQRIIAIQKFLAAQTNGAGGFTVEIHDPAEVGLQAQQIMGSLPQGAPQLNILGAYQKLQSNFQGVFNPWATMGGGASGGAGGAGGSGGMGGGGGGAMGGGVR